MNILIVYAHHSAKSFTAALKNIAVEELTLDGNTVVVSDLYGQKFNPVADVSDFKVVSHPEAPNYAKEQHEATRHDFAYADDIRAEQKKLKEADLVIFHFPLWWFGAPAILKGWFDRVLSAGFAWDYGKKSYEFGLLRGKKAFIVVNGGESESFYHRLTMPHRTTINDVLYPIQYGTLHFCGLDVIEPFIALNVDDIGDAGRAKYLADFRKKLKSVNQDKEPYLYRYD